MTRHLRLNIPDGWYHVFGRGLEQREILGETAGGMDYAAVHMSTKRFEELASTDTETQKRQRRLLLMWNVEP